MNEEVSCPNASCSNNSPESSFEPSQMIKRENYHKYFRKEDIFKAHKIIIKKYHISGHRIRNISKKI